MPKPTPWRCGYCKRNITASAVYCPTCGNHWSECYEEQDSSYAEQPWPEDQRTPRGQNRQKSPRGRDRGGNRQLPKPPAPPAHWGRKGGEGKGKGKDKYKSNQPSMPTGPPPTSPPPPTPSTASSSIDPKMQEMLTALSAHRDSLPDAVKSLLEEREEAQTMDKAKELHRQVDTQRNKSKKLASLRAQREQYVKQWGLYLETLTGTLPKQIAEKDATMQRFATGEATLVEEVNAARAAVLQLAGGERIGSEDLDVDAEPETWFTMPEKHQEAEERLAEMLRRTSQAAAQLAAAERDTSRTPRRKEVAPAGIEKIEKAENKKVSASPNSTEPAAKVQRLDKPASTTAADADQVQDLT